MGWREWTGVGERRWKTAPNEQVQPAKTLWDLLQLLIVPVILVGVSLLWSASQTASDNKREDRRIAADQVAAAQARQDATLVNYIQRMSGLMLHKSSHCSLQSSDDAVWSVARTVTLTSLLRLDGERKGRVVLFLHEASLIDPNSGTRVRLKDADLTGADLTDADLRDADLRGADLTDADLRGADLTGANLFRRRPQGRPSRAPTSRAPTSRAPTSRAPTSGTPTSGAPTSVATFSGAPTSRAPTSGTPTSGTPTSGAPTSRAPTSGAPTSGTPSSRAPRDSPREASSSATRPCPTPRRRTTAAHSSRTGMAIDGDVPQLPADGAHSRPARRIIGALVFQQGTECPQLSSHSFIGSASHARPDARRHDGIGNLGERRQTATVGVGRVVLQRLGVRLATRPV